MGKPFVALEQERLNVGALRMGTSAWLAGLHSRLRDDTPVEEGPKGAVPLHHRIGVEQVAHRGLVKALGIW